MNLKTVHLLIEQGNFSEAKVILTQLCEEFPDFVLYQTKLREFEAALDRKTEVPKRASRDLEQNMFNRNFDHVYMVNLQHQPCKRLAQSLTLQEVGIDFEQVSAVDGNLGKPLETFREYKARPLGKLKKFPEFNNHELNRGHGYIESAGAVGYIYTYINILKDALAKGYRRIFIFEDDVLLGLDFNRKFNLFMSRIAEDWKVILLGASQYDWDSVDQEKSLAQGYYLPRRIHTCGSFAIGLDVSVFESIIEMVSAFEAPFDLLPMGTIYEQNIGKCFVAYPNIAIADVGVSVIRGARNQFNHSEKMKWPLENFAYPPRAPLVSLSLIHI